MALPVLDKTWEIGIVESRSLGQGTNQQINRETMFLLKQSLVVGGAAPWVVEYSCDAVVAGVPGDGIDRWLDRGDCSFGDAGQDGTTNTSWIVLSQAGMGGFELMIHCDNGQAWTGNNSEIYYSPSAGFTGGGLLDAPPTATDQILLIGEGGAWLNGEWNSTIEREYVLYTYRSTDGSCTRIFAWDITRQVNTMHCQLDTIKNPIAELTYPFACVWFSSTGSAHEYAEYNDLAKHQMPSPVDGSAVPLFLTGDGYISSQGGQNVTGINDFTSEYDIYPMGIASNTLNKRGRFGEIFDMWWLPTSLLDHSTMPLTPSATREFMVVGDMLMVHDGSIPITF